MARPWRCREPAGRQETGLGCHERLGIGGFAFGFELLVGEVGALLGGFVVHLLGIGAENRHKGGVGADGVEAGPGFGGCASPGGVDEADGDVLFLLEVASEEVGDGGEACGGFGGALRPADGGLDVFEGIVRAVFFNAEEADLRVVGGGDFFGGVLDDGVAGEAEQRHLHVGLAGGKPEIADENVVEGEGVCATDSEGEGAAGGLGGKIDAPAMKVVGGGGGGRTVEVDGDLLAWFGLAPDVDGHVALEDHVAGEDLGEGDVGVRGSGQQGQGEDEFHVKSDLRWEPLYREWRSKEKRHGLRRASEVGFEVRIIRSSA